MVKLDKVSFSYGKTNILNNLSLTAENGKCLVIAGPNGSGKSTLLSIIAGARKASSGKTEISDKIGYVPQGISLFEDLSVKENIRFFASVSKTKFIDLNLLPFNLAPIANKKISKLSIGMKKRVSIVCALVSDPSVIILDEPCAALDILYRDELLELINKLKSNGKTIIYVGHDFNEISRIYDTLLLIKNGNTVFYKTKDELPSSSDELEEYVRNKINGLNYELDLYSKNVVSFDNAYSPLVGYSYKLKNPPQNNELFVLLKYFTSTYKKNLKIIKFSPCLSFEEQDHKLHRTSWHFHLMTIHLVLRCNSLLFLQNQVHNYKAVCRYAVLVYFHPHKGHQYTKS